jgi:general secretion pathway protein D
VAAPDKAASSAAVESPRLIRGTDKVLGSASTPPMKLDGTPIDLRFEDTPVREAVHAILGDLLKQDYVVYPPVDGRVTSRRRLSRPTAVFLLEAALQANGLAMARDARGVFHRRSRH